MGAVRTNGTAATNVDAIASYSSKGLSFIDRVAKPALVAPGNLVTSLHSGVTTLQQANPTFFTPNNFYQNNGTPNDRCGCIVHLQRNLLTFHHEER